VFARSQFWDHASIRPVRGDLRENYVGNNLLSGTHHGGSCLVARAFNAQDVNVSHDASLNGIGCVRAGSLSGRLRGDYNIR
jgi:hypothetical protein